MQDSYDIAEVVVSIGAIPMSRYDGLVLDAESKAAEFGLSAVRIRFCDDEVEFSPSAARGREVEPLADQTCRKVGVERRTFSP
ncbi:MAG: hypothetical protein FJ091_20660 [Deltaproteobacteria bacterium]|nr:hypothetical protein [Deltaproteobacteria bacterium]